MKVKRLLKKVLIPGYNAYDLVTKVNEDGVVGGVKKKLKEDFIEDMPVVGNLYDMAKEEGRVAGKVEGYVEASNEYEKKLLSQAETFLKQKNKLAENIQQREVLLDEYEVCIEKMENELESLTKEQLVLLNKMKAMQNRLENYEVK